MMLSLLFEWTNTYQHFCRHARRHRKPENNRVPLSGLAEDLHCEVHPHCGSDLKLGPFRYSASFRSATLH